MRQTSTSRRSVGASRREVILRHRARGLAWLFVIGGTCAALSCARTDEPHPIADASILDADSELDASELDAQPIDTD